MPYISRVWHDPQKVFRIFLTAMLPLVFSVMLLIFPPCAFSQETHSRLQLITLSGSDPERIETAQGILKQSGIPFQGVAEAAFLKESPAGGKSPVLLLILPRTLSHPAEVKLEQWAADGGKLILIPGKETTVDRFAKLFEAIRIKLNGTAYLSQSSPLVWNKSQSVSPLPSNEEDVLPVGSRLLMMGPINPDTRIPATWGETYPALALSPKGAVLNWEWGNELSSDTNIRLLRWILQQWGPTDVSMNNSSPQKTASAENGGKNCHLQNAARFDEINRIKEDVDGSSHEEPCKTGQPEFGVYFKNMRDLDDLKKRANDAVETGIQLYLPISVKDIRQLVLKSDIHKANFESLYLKGDIEKGFQEFGLAKRLLVKAVVLASPSNRVEGRALWLDRGSILAAGGPAGLKKLLQDIHRTGINVVYFETINSGFSLYTSRFLVENPLVKNWDPLQVAIAEGHRLGMEVHAWVWCFAVGNIRHNSIIGLPTHYPGPILQEKGLMSEALHRADGGLTEPGQNEFWLSPASPKAREFLKNVYSEIVTNYEVDGLQLDYIRYPFQSSQTLMGFESIGRERFGKETGLSLSKLNDITLKTWAAWKTNQVSGFVRDISHALKSIKPNLKLSAAVFPMSRAERILAIQQDWETWIKNGWIDTLNPMTYTSSSRQLRRMVDYVLSEAGQQTIVYPGLAINRLEPEDLLKQIETVREAGALGSTFFAMAHLDPSKQAVLSEGPYKQADVLPPHQDPVKSMLTLVQDYNNKFAQLQKKQELLNLPPDTIIGIQTSLDGLQQTLQAGTKVDLQKIADQVQALSMHTALWMKKEEEVHPFRMQYFSGIMLEIRYLSTYLSKKSILSEVTVMR